MAFRPIKLDEAIKKKGMKRVLGLVKRQASLILDAAIQNSLVEIRLKEMTVTGKVYFEFTGEILFPENIMDQFVQPKQRRLAAQLPLVTLMTGTADPSDEYDPKQDPYPDLLESWTLMDIDKNGCSFQLIFKEPLEVSTGSEPDRVFVQFNFGEFTDSNDNQMPESILKSIMIPRQAASEAEAKAVD